MHPSSRQAPSDRACPVTTSQQVEGPGPPPTTLPPAAAAEGGPEGAPAAAVSSGGAEAGVGDKSEQQPAPASTSDGGNQPAPDDPAADASCEKKEGAGKWATEVCPWEDE